MNRYILETFLSQEFEKYKVAELCGHLGIKVKGAIRIDQIQRLATLIPAGTQVYFMTMGFWESKFSKTGAWKNCLI